MDLVPEELRTEIERNRRYAEMLLRNVYPTPQERTRRREQLGLRPTPYDVVHEENSLRLCRFRSSDPTVRPRKAAPVLMVPSLILRYYVLDLMKEHSLIEHLVDRGFDVWLCDWGVPGREHGAFAFDDYVGTFLRRCVRHVLRRTGESQLTLFGQCLGGILAAMYTAISSEQIERLICLTTPIDFRDAGLLSLWTRKETFHLESVLAGFGDLIPAEFVHSWFRYLDVRATVESYKRLYNNVLDEGFVRNYSALDEWLNDKIPFAAPAFANLIRDLYQENALVQGKMRIQGKQVDLGRIKCPLLNITAEFDHVFPEQCARALNDISGGPVEHHRAPTGHVTCVTLFPQRLDTFRRISEFLG